MGAWAGGFMVTPFVLHGEVDPLLQLGPEPTRANEGPLGPRERPLSPGAP